MVIFHSYVSLPEGRFQKIFKTSSEIIWCTWFIDVNYLPRSPTRRAYKFAESLNAVLDSLGFLGFRALALT